MGKAEKLGKLEKPSAEEFEKGRKLFFLPLVFTPEKGAPEFKEIIEKYWQQALEHIDNLETKLTPVKKVYHEWVTGCGDDGLKTIEALGAGSKDIAKRFIEKGASVQPVEEKELLDEFMDWGRCLSLGLVSQKVFSRAYNAYIEVQKKRQESISKKIDENLGADEVGLLVMREGHQVQFPQDIQVFYVSPPALDEIKKWLRDNQEKPKK